MCLVYRKIKHNPAENNGGRLFTFAPCGRCEDCRNHSRYAWAWRLTSDIQYCVEKKGYRVGFITLTYNDEHLPRFPEYLDDECEVVNPLGGLPSFSKEDTLSLILYLRKVLHREYGLTGLLYFLASEYGPATQRPHYHMILAWPSRTEKINKRDGVVTSYDVTAEMVHHLIKHYWTEYKQLGFISPKSYMGGESKRSGKAYLPFEVENLSDCLNSCFYTAKYVTKDIYFMDDMLKVVNDSISLRLKDLEDWKSSIVRDWRRGYLDDDCYKEFLEQFSNQKSFYQDKYIKYIFSHEKNKLFMPHHRQTKSLGFESIKSLSDLEKVDLLNRGKLLLGNDRLAMPPLYIRNKLMFKPCYWIDSNGKRLVKQECSEFYKKYFDLIMDKKVSYFDVLFDSMKDTQYWLSSGLSERDSVLVSSLLSYPPNFGMKLSEAYIYYFGVPVEHCYVDKKFTLINRYKFPCYPALHMQRLDSSVWKKIQVFFIRVMHFCRWEISSIPDHDMDYVKDLFNQPLTA